MKSCNKNVLIFIFLAFNMVMIASVEIATMAGYTSHSTTTPHTASKVYSLAENNIAANKRQTIENINSHKNGYGCYFYNESSLILIVNGENVRQWSPSNEKQNCNEIWV